MGKITVNHITKIEGHARLDLEVKDGQLKRCELGSVEGSRYFQALLKDRHYTDAPEITSRICGICSSSHGVASVMALENAFGIKPSSQTLRLRELQTIGERVRSHATHTYFLALPDYLGFESGLAMAPKFKTEVARALRLVKLGNDLVKLVSGRIMHQICTTIGGFTHFPTQDELDEVLKRFKNSEEDALETLKLFASLEYPELENTAPYFCLTRESDYATSYGDVMVGEKIFKQKNYLDVIEEYHERWSNANFVVKEGKSFYVGSLARLNNNIKQLHPKAKKAMDSIGFKLPCHNPFKNNLAQAIELVHHIYEGIDILSKLKIAKEDPIVPKNLEGHGIAANEAPRGTLWHEYKINSKGLITHANVIAPTTQMLRNMQDNIAIFAQSLLDKDADKDTIKFEVEKLIRSYDPCFSCATHFLEVVWH